MDDGEYTYPVLEVKHLVDWDEVNPQIRAAPYAYPYGRSMYAYPYSYWGPYGGMGGWYGGVSGVRVRISLLRTLLWVRRWILRSKRAAARIRTAAV